MRITLKPSDQRIKVNFTALYKADGNEYEKGFNEGYENGFNAGRDSKIIQPLTIRENGTYTANEIDGYNPVMVEVKLPSDTTATAEDIRKGKTAYIGGVKVTGTAERSLKKLLDTTKSCASWFLNVISTDEIVNSLFEFDDTENVTSMYMMFATTGMQYWLKNAPAMNAKNVKTMEAMFRHHGGLIKPYNYDTSNVTNMAMMYDSTGITEVPLHNTTNVLNMMNMCLGCASLVKVPSLDCRSATNLNNMFATCSKLEEIWIKNIKANFVISYSSNVKQECIIHLIKELRDTGSAKTLTVGATNLAKIADTYVKIITITDEMREQDDLIDEKLPFEICESTDERAMLITEYVLQKNWQIAG